MTGDEFSVWPCHVFRHPVILSVVLSRFPASGGSQCGSVTLPGIRWFSVWPCHASRYPVVLTVALSRFPASGGSHCGSVTPSGIRLWVRAWHIDQHLSSLTAAVSLPSRTWSHSQCQLNPRWNQARPSFPSVSHFFLLFFTDHFTESLTHWFTKLDSVN